MCFLKMILTKMSFYKQCFVSLAFFLKDVFDKMGICGYICNLFMLNVFILFQSISLIIIFGRLFQINLQFVRNPEYACNPVCGRLTMKDHEFKAIQAVQCDTFWKKKRGRRRKKDRNSEAFAVYLKNPCAIIPILKWFPKFLDQK